MNVNQAIDELEDTLDGLLQMDEYYVALEMAIEALKRTQWISVSERLPDAPSENPMFENKPLELYLVSVKDAEYPIRAFWNGKNFTDGWMKLDVIAWMELPEPYKEE